MTELDATRARLAALENLRESTDDETTARAAADEINELLDRLDNVSELPR